MSDRVDSPIGAYEKPPKRYSPDPDADPDLERWQRDRWAPHGDMNEPAPPNGLRDFPEDGSLHDRSRKFDAELVEWDEAVKANEADDKPKPKRRVKK